MRRRTFIKSLAGFGVALGLDKFEFTRSWPFVQRAQVLEIVAKVTAVGKQTITFPVSCAKDDLLVAVIASYQPDGVFIEPSDQPEWTLMSRQEAGNVVQRFWYMKSDRVLVGHNFKFAVDGASNLAGQVCVIRGVEGHPVSNLELPWSAVTYPIRS